MAGIRSVLTRFGRMAGMGSGDARDLPPRSVDAFRHDETSKPHQLPVRPPVRPVIYLVLEILLVTVLVFFWL